MSKFLGVAKDELTQNQIDQMQTALGNPADPTQQITARRFLGTATDDQGTPDAVFKVSRTHAIGTSPHSFRDETIFSPSISLKAIASFDAALSIQTALPVDHIIGFQSRSGHVGPGLLSTQYGCGTFNNNTGSITVDYAFYNGNIYNGTVGACYGFYNQPTHSTNTNTSYGYVHAPTIDAGKTVTNSAGVRIETVAGAGTLTNEFGVYVTPLTKGGVKWPLYIAAQTGTTFLGSPVQLANTVNPDTDNTRSIGTALLRLVNVFANQFRPGAGTAIWTSGAGTPEAAVTAPVGSLFTRTDGGANTTLYVKESGAGNTGWVAK